MNKYLFLIVSIVILFLSNTIVCMENDKGSEEQLVMIRQVLEKVQQVEEHIQKKRSEGFVAAVHFGHLAEHVRQQHPVIIDLPTQFRNISGSGDQTSEPSSWRENVLWGGKYILLPLTAASLLTGVVVWIAKRVSK